ncbi:hypothetical protein [Hymenobacter persicinus]|uniref:Uncharacterized protein n=1 Tax=Hymenobacter persicinus TaxID=2025506 RepID=A0A4Q5LBT9_9BACT|nr:hypothetical protein [Hymenobacter persicinus]RYU78769.1 hypothetical protein EWM57_12630 [Hymenobacter persicinus]
MRTGKEGKSWAMVALYADEERPDKWSPNEDVGRSHLSKSLEAGNAFTVINILFPQNSYYLLFINK